jgi:hypothetical protein
MTEFYSILWTYHILFVNSSADRHRLFHPLALMNNAAMFILSMYKFRVDMSSLFLGRRDEGLMNFRDMTESKKGRLGCDC